MRLLLVEDDTMIGDSVRQGLRQDGFAVDWVQDGEAAELALRTTEYALMILSIAAAGVAAWLITVLSGRVASGHFAAAVTDTFLFLPYLAIGAGCAAVALYATRIPRGTYR